jgi:hypothetical protein
MDGATLRLLWVACIAGLAACAHHFPARSFGPFGETWRDYSQHLSAAREAPLGPTGSAKREVYRFLWLRSFDNTIVVRIIRTGDRFELLAKRLDGAWVLGPGRIVEETRKKLHRQEWERFTRLLVEARFWELRTEDELIEEVHRICRDRPKECPSITVVADGARWVLEGANKRRHHVVDRDSTVSGSYRDACLMLLELSNVDTGRIY